MMSGVKPLILCSIHYRDNPLDAIIHTVLSYPTNALLGDGAEMTMIIVITPAAATNCFPTFGDAITFLRAQHGAAVVVYGADGGAVHGEGDMGQGRSLAWANEASSVGDPGARAVASLRLVEKF